MKTIVRKLDPNMHGPNYFAVLTEQEMIELGYVYEFHVFNDEGLCVRTGLSKIKTEIKLWHYIDSGMNRIEWEALHGTD